MIETYIEDMLVKLGEQYVRMSVRVFNPRDSHATAFCIHGFEQNGAYFTPLAALLARKGIRVVAPDFPGRGRSAWLDDPSMYNLGTYGACLAHIARYRGRENYMIGTSWGAAVGLATLASTGGYVDKIVLNDMVMRSGPALDDSQDFLRKDAGVSFTSFEEAAAYVRRSRAYLGRIPEEIWSAYLAEKIGERNGRFVLTWDPELMHSVKHQAPFDLAPLVSALQIPTLLLYGKNSAHRDPAYNEHLRATRPHIVIAEDIDAGHPPSLMTREQGLLVLGFLLS